jgi:hypothetical protein
MRFFYWFFVVTGLGTLVLEFYGYIYLGCNGCVFGQGSFIPLPHVVQSFIFLVAGIGGLCLSRKEGVV